MSTTISNFIFSDTRYVLYLSYKYFEFLFILFFLIFLQNFFLHTFIGRFHEWLTHAHLFTVSVSVTNNKRENDALQSIRKMIFYVAMNRKVIDNDKDDYHRQNIRACNWDNEVQHLNKMIPLTTHSQSVSCVYFISTVNNKMHKSKGRFNLAK